jgi:site-specific recombinase XerD
MRNVMRQTLFSRFQNTISNLHKNQGNLAFYVARLSWSTIGKEMNVIISVISEGLGHEDIKTTQIYPDDFDNAATN